MKILSDLGYSRRALAGFAVIGFGWSSLWAQMPDLKTQIGASDAHFGAMLLMGSTGAILSMIFSPVFSAWLGRAAMPVAALAMALGFFVLGMAQGPILFMAALFIGAGGSGVLDVLVNAEVSEQEAASGRSLMNLNHGFFSICYAFGAVSVGLARGADWSPVAVFAVNLIVALGLLRWLSYSVNVATDTTEGGGRRLPHLLIFTGGTVVLVAFMAEAATEAWSAIHVERSLGGTVTQGSLGPAILGLAMGVGRIGGHFVSNRLPDLPFMGVALGLAVLGCTLVGLSTTVLQAYVGFALAGLGVSVVGPLGLAIVGRSVPSTLRLKAISRAVTMGYGAFFIGPPVMGFVSQAFGLYVAFWVMAACLFLALVIGLPILALAQRRNQSA